MSAREDRSSRRADVWLVEGLGKSGKGKRGNGNGSGDWSESGQRRTAVQPANGKPKRRFPLTSRRSQRKIDAYRTRIAELEALLAEERAQSKAKVTALRDRAKKGAPVPVRGKLNANTATFEQLREIGLSVTQSAKLVGRREAAGGFNSAAELKRIPGMSAAARETIAARLKVTRGS